ncbi:hypothetical protein PG996_014486 [Apiospora saccharicola]|uniref:Uncharacterized protein n=1 Tax=Apiospora saccharicola TaxID=335842 RepID=A0ABR1TIJ3_9PEZI
MPFRGVAHTTPATFRSSGAIQFLLLKSMFQTYQAPEPGLAIGMFPMEKATTSHTFAAKPDTLVMPCDLVADGRCAANRRRQGGQFFQVRPVKLS